MKLEGSLPRKVEEIDVSASTEAMHGIHFKFALWQNVLAVLKEGGKHGPENCGGKTAGSGENQCAYIYCKNKL